ncbi:MAG TPA: ATP-binding protein [Phycisphaerae bacterium]|nr:ATP-binding protein [Phycisphaerae bacterium]
MIETMERPAEISQRERELAGIISSYNEVTERLKEAHERLEREVARLHDELRQKNMELRRRDRLAALGEMAAGLAHEIRNPLGGIALYSSMLERELDAASPAHGAAAKITIGVRTLERLVSDILDFAQERPLQRHACRMADLLPGLDTSIEPWADQCRCQLIIEPKAGECALYCDSERLGQALLNLLMNAVQAAGEKGTAWLSARLKSDGAEIEVWDSGPGIPRDDLDRIFNPFFTTKAQGTGLGLAIVHQIVEAHGGTIRAGNRNEGGARFVIWLPGAEAASAARPPRYEETADEDEGPLVVSEK